MKSALKIASGVLLSAFLLIAQGQVMAQYGEIISSGTDQGCPRQQSRWRLKERDDQILSPQKLQNANFQVTHKIA